MSIRSDLRTAARDLAGGNRVFTRIDVVNAAAAKRGWSKAMFAEAREEAGTILNALYSNQEVSRYGPVEFHEGGKDFVRLASEIVYGGANAPDVVESDNGGWGRAHHGGGQVPQQVGRRMNWERNDFEEWPAELAAKAKRGTAKGTGSKKEQKRGPQHVPPAELVERLRLKVGNLEEALGQESAKNAELARELENSRKANERLARQNGKGNAKEVEELRERLAEAEAALEKEQSRLPQQHPAGHYVGKVVMSEAEIADFAKYVAPFVAEIVAQQLAVNPEEIAAQVREKMAEALIS